MARVVVFVAVSIVLAGCGSSNPPSKSISPAAQARAVVEQYYADIEHGNAGAACALITASVRAEIEGAMRLFPTTVAHRDHCLWSFVERAKGLRRRATPRRVSETKVGQATVVGDRATVRVIGRRRHTNDLSLVKTAEGWRISKLPVRKPIGG